jgi:hypothetical protein
MKDAYVDVFRNVVKETQRETGFELPEQLEVYVVMLLANFLDKPDFLPERSFTDSYIKLKTSQSAKELGDVCLFLTGVFPSYGSKYNINRSYYSSIGISSYEKAAHTLNYNVFMLLSRNFEYVQNLIELSTSNRKFKSIIL